MSEDPILNRQVEGLISVCKLPDGEALWDLLAIMLGNRSMEPIGFSDQLEALGLTKEQIACVVNQIDAVPPNDLPIIDRPKK